MGFFNSNEEYKIKKVNEKLAQNTQDLDDRGVNVLFPPPPLVAAIGDGVNDDTGAIQNILDNYNTAYAPPKIYNIAGMLEITSGRTLNLSPKAILKRFSSTSESTEPVVWVKGSDAVLKGDGYSSKVISENRSPKGVVRLGHKDMTESHANVTYSKISGLTIMGNTQYGQAEGDPDIALYVPNPQFDSLVSYFHTLENLKFENANYGLYLHGWANANFISNIQGYRIGNTQSGHNALIYCHGALDNACNNVFFHGSPDSTGLKVDGYDNTANGGSIHNPYANSWLGLVFEQGGPNAKGLVQTSLNTKSFYDIRHNVSGGNILPSDFHDNNHWFGLGGSSVKTQKTLKTKTQETDKIIGIEQAFDFTDLAENTAYKIVDITLSNRQSALVEIDFASYSPTSLNYHGSGKVVYSVSKDGSGVMSVQTLSTHQNGSISLCNGVINTGIASIVFRVANNGTSTNGYGFRGIVKVIHPDVETRATFYTTSTISEISGTTLPKNTTFVASKTFDPPSLSTGSQTTTTLTVTGARFGDVVSTSFNKDLQGILLSGYVSASDTVTIIFRNDTGATIDLASGTLKATTTLI